MANITIDKYVRWRIDTSTPLEQQFYPSTFKKILKDSPKYEELFETTDEVADKDFLERNFLPIYDKVIGSKSSYIFKPGEQKAKLFTKIDEGRNYKCYSLWSKQDRQFVGGTLHFTKNGGEYISLRAFDKDINRKYRFRATIDYWAEKEFRKFVLSSKADYLSHGKDSYPNTGYIGLSLFKIKCGAVPMRSKIETNTVEMTKDDINKYDHLTFFDNPDENDVFKRLNIYFKSGTIDPSLLNEFQSVCEWAGIELSLHESS